MGESRFSSIINEYQKAARKSVSKERGCNVSSENLEHTSVLQCPLFQDEVEGEQVTLQQLQATALHHYNHLPH